MDGRVNAASQRQTSRAIQPRGTLHFSLQQARRDRTEAFFGQSMRINLIQRNKPTEPLPPKTGDQPFARGIGLWCGNEGRGKLDPEDLDGAIHCPPGVFRNRIPSFPLCRHLTRTAQPFR